MHIQNINVVLKFMYCPVAATNSFNYDRSWIICQVWRWSIARLFRTNPNITNLFQQSEIDNAWFINHVNILHLTFLSYDLLKIEYDDLWEYFTFHSFLRNWSVTNRRAFNCAFFSSTFYRTLITVSVLPNVRATCYAAGLHRLIDPLSRVCSFASHLLLYRCRNDFCIECPRAWFSFFIIRPESPSPRASPAVDR